MHLGKLLLGTAAFHMGLSGSSLNYTALLMDLVSVPVKWKLMLQERGTLPPTSDTKMEFLALAFIWPSSLARSLSLLSHYL